MPRQKKEKAVDAAKKSDPKFAYNLEIEMNDCVHKFETNDFHQTLKDFKESEAFPSIIKTRVIFRYNNGKVFREKFFFQTIDARREFENKLNLELLANTMKKELDA